MRTGEYQLLTRINRRSQEVLTPAVGGPVVIKAFMVVILGGLGSIPGAVVGSLAFGALESFGTTFFGGYSSLAAFSAVMLILIFRPRGLLGRALSGAQSSRRSR